MDLSKLKIGLHQDLIVTGDIKGNFDMIIQRIQEDHKNEVELSIFPETAISGYMCGSLWDRDDFVRAQKDAMQSIEMLLYDIGFEGAVIIGFVDFLGHKSNGYPHLKNAAAIITKDSTRIYHKQLLASADHHEDKKYFDRGEETKVFEVVFPSVGPVRIGIPICEDIWYNEHKRDIPGEMVEGMGADILININQSYFYYGKQEKRYNLLSKLAQRLSVPIISCNALGVGDILKNIVVFDGGSMIFNFDGQLLYEFHRFKEQNEALVFGELMPEEFLYPSKYEEITQAILFEQKEFFRVSGLKKAQVHVSGGLDSAIVASLVVESMEPENTVLITNPSKLNENSDSMDYVHKIEEELGVKIWENPIEDIANQIMNTHTMSFDWADIPPQGKASIHAVLRTVQGLAASHQFGSGIVATGNHTEIVLGWASFHDIGSIGVHAILGDLTKVELYKLAEYLNKDYFQREVIPEDLYNGKFKPAAELPDAMEDPINYHLQSGICALLIRERISKLDLMFAFNTKNKEILTPDLFPDQGFLWSHTMEQWEKEVDFAINSMKRSVYKAAQGAPIVIMSPRSRGFSNRETLINHYKEKEIK